MCSDRTQRIDWKRTTPALLAALWLVSACASSNRPAPSRLERGAEGSFTITQDVRVGAGVRSDFDEALHLIEEADVERGIDRLLAVTVEAPQLASAHINLGIAYRRIEDWEKAEASIARALELSPRHPVALNEHGMVLRRQGRFEEARTSYEQALTVAPEFHYARRNLAILCDLFLGDLDCAIENYQRYAHEFPGDEEVAMWIADLQRRAPSPPANGEVQ